MKVVLAFALLLSCSATLSAQTEFLQPKGLSAPHGYTHAVTASGKLVLISGQVANDAEGHLVGKGDLRAQTKQVFENLKLALASAGASFDDVVKINWYVKGYRTDYLPILREVRDAYVNKEHPPASTLVGVAALFQDDYLLEVEATAVIPEKRNKSTEKRR